jgi:hypothetical protein
MLMMLFYLSDCSLRSFWPQDNCWIYLGSCFRVVGDKRDPSGWGADHIDPPMRDGKVPSKNIGLVATTSW